MNRLLVALGLALLLHGALFMGGASWLASPPEPLALRSGISVALDFVTADQNTESEKRVEADHIPAVPPQPLQIPDPVILPVPSPEQVVEVVPFISEELPEPLNFVARQHKILHPQEIPVEEQEVEPEPPVAPVSASSILPETESAVDLHKTMPAADASAKVVRQASPLYQENPPPDYPVKAQRRGWEGRVLVTVQVTAAGSVSGISLGGSSGYSLLDQAALKAVRSWRFVPAMHFGRPVASSVTVPVVFQLD